MDGIPARRFGGLTMKNMKKLWALLLALAMTFSLAACGGSTTEEDTADDQTTEDTATDDTAAESDLAYVQDKGTLVVRSE